MDAIMDSLMNAVLQTVIVMIDQIRSTLPCTSTRYSGSWCRYSDIIDKAITGWACDARCRLHDVLQIDPLCFWTWNIVPSVPDRRAKFDFL